MHIDPSFDPPERILLGPGPSHVPARVLAALARPTVGYLDPTYVTILEDVQALLRRVFVTDNAATFAISGPGTAAMECGIMHGFEPGDPVVCCTQGYFGERMCEMATRNGAELHRISAPWCSAIEPAVLQATLRAIGKVALVTVVHGETSTGVMQPDVAELARITHEHGALLLVDTVASLGGVEFSSDALGADIVYTGAQKCLSVPPGISPITFSERAMERIRARKRPPASWYLDVPLNLTIWQRPHAYHHTGATNLMYALREGLVSLFEEGLDERIDRTRRTAAALWAGMEGLGLALLVPPALRLPTLTTIGVPAGVDEARVRATLLRGYGIEIAGGLGDLKGRAWRVGLMGASCSSRNVVLLLTALAAALGEQGVRCDLNAALEAATTRLPSA